jgi:hypothetical protein
LLQAALRRPPLQLLPVDLDTLSTDLYLLYAGQRRLEPELEERGIHIV